MQNKENQSLNQNEQKFNSIAVFEYLPDSEIALRYVSPLEALQDKYEIANEDCLGFEQTFVTIDGKAHIAAKESIEKHRTDLEQQGYFRQINTDFTTLLSKENATWKDADDFCENLLANSTIAKTLGILQSKFVELFHKYQELKVSLAKAEKERDWANDFVNEPVVA